MDNVKSFWQEWRGSMDGRPSMFIRNLFSFRGYKLDLHKMVRADDPTCFHTHPAKAIRFILWGGYTEQILINIFDSKDRHSYSKKQWIIGDIGIVRPDLCHRIDSLHKQVSYSLWFRFPKTHSIHIEGEC